MRRVLLSLVALGGLSLLAAPASAADHSPFQLLGTQATVTANATADQAVAAPVTTVAYRPYYGGYYNRGYYGRPYYGGYYRPYGSYYRGGYYGGYPGYYGRGIGLGFGFY